MLTGFVDVVVRHRVLVAMLAGDPGAVEMLRSQTVVSDLIDRQFRLIAAVEPGVGGWIKADMVMAGIAGGMSARTRGLDDDVLRPAPGRGQPAHPRAARPTVPPLTSAAHHAGADDARQGAAGAGQV
jgi:hypothetical protein